MLAAWSRLRPTSPWRRLPPCLTRPWQKKMLSGQIAAEKPEVESRVWRSRGRLLSTLRPEHLKPSDHMDWSGITKPMVTYGDGIHSLIPYYGYKKDYRMIFVPFPAGTQGFLYFSRPALAPPHVGEIRFRVVPSADPADFRSGYDLKSHDNVTVFKRTVTSVAATPTYAAFIHPLLRDGFMHQHQLDSLIKACSEYVANVLQRPRGIWRCSTVLCAFQQPFHLDFANVRASMRALGTENGKLVVDGISFEIMKWRIPTDGCGKKPYSGSAFCCFERDTQDNVYIKVLKITQPVKYLDDLEARMYPEPREGEYLENTLGPWRRNLGSLTPNMKGLRLLKEYPGVEWDMS